MLSQLARRQQQSLPTEENRRVRQPIAMLGEGQEVPKRILFVTSYEATMLANIQVGRQEIYYQCFRFEEGFCKSHIHSPSPPADDLDIGRHLQVHQSHLQVLQCNQGRVVLSVGHHLPAPVRHRKGRRGERRRRHRRGKGHAVHTLG